MTPEDETRQLVGGIAESVQTLTVAVTDLATRQAAQLRRTRRALRWTIVGLAVDLALTAVGALLYIQVQHNSDDLRTVNTRVSTQALCPLYEVFLKSYNPTSPQAKADPAQYEHSFVVIEQGARALGCQQVTRGR